MKNTVNAEIASLPSTGWIARLAASQRRKMFDAFTAFRGTEDEGTILNVRMLGASPTDGADHLIEWSSPQTVARITSWEICPAADRDAKQAGSLKTLRLPDGSHLPFADGQFDWVYCNETIEHVGNFERQFELVKELNRVARKGVFLTTSNRLHPLEFNTGLPLVHLLPAGWRRMAGRKVNERLRSLFLVDSSVLYRIARLLPGKPEHDVGHKRILGIKAHFFLMLTKAATS